MKESNEIKLAKPGTASLSGRMVGYWIDPATGKVTSTRVVIGGAE